MGNCSQKSTAVVTSPNNKNPIRIMTDSGRVMELHGPKMAKDILDIFPGYGIYHRDQFSLPLFEDEVLCNGQIYHLLPFGMSRRHETASSSFRRDQSSAFEVLPSRGNGVWRVKMAIDSRELEEMLSPENAEALVEMMRSAAKTAAKAAAPSPTRRSFGWRRPSLGVISCGVV